MKKFVTIKIPIALQATLYRLKFPGESFASVISRIFYKDYTCEKCGSEQSNSKQYIIIHHKDKNRKNNFYSNLQVLCKSCHQSIHPRRIKKEVDREQALLRQLQ